MSKPKITYSFAQCEDSRLIIYWKNHLPKSTERYQITTQQREIKNRNLPNEFSFKNYLTKKGIYYQMTIHDSTQFALVKSETNLASFKRDIQNFIHALWEKNLHTETVQLLEAICFGNKSAMDQASISNFQKLGLMHLIAISGMHVAIIYQLIIFILSRSWLFGNKYRWIKTKHLITVLILLFYAWLCNFSPSVLRAIFMFSALFYSFHHRRPISSIYILIICGGTVLFFDPLQLFDMGFQFSYLATFGILIALPFVKRVEKLIPNKILKFLVISTLISLVVQLFLIPLLLFYFGQFPLWFWLFQIPALLLVTVLLVGGVLSILFLQIPILDRVISTLLDKLTHLLMALLHLGEQLPLHFLNFRIKSEFTIVFYYLILFLLFQLLVKFDFKKVKWLIITFAIFIGYHTIIDKLNSNIPLHFSYLDQKGLIIGIEKKYSMTLISNYSLDKNQKEKFKNYARYQNRTPFFKELKSTKEAAEYEKFKINSQDEQAQTIYFFNYCNENLTQDFPIIFQSNHSKFCISKNWNFKETSSPVSWGYTELNPQHSIIYIE
ncbi:MAG: ComEC family competence protein [Flavobacteriales bacterium]|nr:ComEC family competence protein [Flavobacteriales bacterium]